MRASRSNLTERVSHEQRFRQFGSLPVALTNTKAFIHIGNRSFNPRERDDGLLPGKAVERYEVVLDYPKGLFTIADAGCLKHRGKRISTPFAAASGHPMIEASVAGKAYHFLLDTGSTMTLARRSLLQKLVAEHPDWPHSIGAVGAADMPSATGRELLVRVPEIQIAGFTIRNVAIVSRADSTYSPENYETPEPIVGAIGGNVLSNFRVEIDYPDQGTYLEQSRQPRFQDMDTVGLVLSVNSTGKLVVVGLASDASSQTQRNLHPGDVLLKIGNTAPAVWTLAAASQALAGKPGEEKHILLLRNGKRVLTTATVAKIL